MRKLQPWRQALKVPPEACFVRPLPQTRWARLSLMLEACSQRGGNYVISFSPGTPRARKKELKPSTLAVPGKGEFRDTEIVMGGEEEEEGPRRKGARCPACAQKPFCDVLTIALPRLPKKLRKELPCI